MAEPESKSNRCPFCHLNIPPWEDGWRAHLTGARPCSAHPRLKHMAPGRANNEKHPVIGFNMSMSMAGSKIPKPVAHLTGSLRRSGNTPTSSPKGTPRSKRRAFYWEHKTISSLSAKSSVHTTTIYLLGFVFCLVDVFLLYTQKLQVLHSSLQIFY